MPKKTSVPVPQSASVAAVSNSGNVQSQSVSSSSLSVAASNSYRATPSGPMDVKGPGRGARGGSNYQIYLLMTAIFNAYVNQDKGFKLAAEYVDAGKFDDIAIWMGSPNQPNIYFVQAKHTTTGATIISDN